LKKLNVIIFSDFKDNITFYSNITENESLKMESQSIKTILQPTSLYQKYGFLPKELLSVLTVYLSIVFGASSIGKILAE